MLLDVTASTLSEIFQNSAGQLLALLINASEVGETLQEKVVVEGEDISSLLDAWLNALLGLVRDQQILPKRFKLSPIETTPGMPYSLRADIIGELLDPQRHIFLKQPKSIHMRESLLETTEVGWRAQITL